MHAKQIAVIRLWAIGESLLALPAVQALKQQWPSSEITAITTPRIAPVFRGQPFIDRVDVVFPHRLRFDLVIDFEPYFYASALLAHTLGTYAVGFDTMARGRLYTKVVPYHVHQHVVKTNFDLVRALGVEVKTPEELVPLKNPHPNPLPIQGEGKNRIAIAPGGGVDFRRWPAERFAEVADYLIEKYGCEVLLVGDEADEPILRIVAEKMKYPAQIISNLSLPEVAQVLSRCRLTIANDGGLMHVSAAMGTPTLGLFGPETPVRFGPYGPSHRALYHQLDGNPVIQVQRGITGRAVADHRPERFVQAITISEVVQAADAMLSQEPRPR